MLRACLLLCAAAAALALPATALADETIALVPGAAGTRPNSVTITAGERVVWRNDDRVARRIVGDGGSFTTPLLRPGQSAVVRFPGIGTFGFHDARRPQLRGAVVVEVPPHTVTIRASATDVRGATRIVFAGTISPARAGERIQLLRLEPDGSVNILDTTLTRRGGRWSLASDVSATGRYRVRWVTAESRVLRIRVR